MENLIVGRSARRNQDGTFYYEWFPLNEELIGFAVHGQDFNTKQNALEYEMKAHIELVNCINANFDKPLYQVNANSVEHSLYIKRKEDGIQAVNALMAELRNQSLQFGFPESVNRHIENRLQPVKQDVETGWWKSALDKISTIEPDQYLTQSLINRVKSTISTYINENYSVTFI